MLPAFSSESGLKPTEKAAGNGTNKGPGRGWASHGLFCLLTLLKAMNA